MNIDLNIAKKALNEFTGYRISKELGVSEMAVSKWRNGTVAFEDIKLKYIIGLYEMQNQEENKMTQAQLLELIKEELASMDEEIRDNLYDVYFQPSDNHIWLMDSGMEYSGDDKEAYYVAQIEEQEVISWA